MRGAAAAFLNVDTCGGAPGLRYDGEESICSKFVITGLEAGGTAGGGCFAGLDWSCRARDDGTRRLAGRFAPSMHQLAAVQRMGREARPVVGKRGRTN
jgi:hypothetical protein